MTIQPPLILNKCFNTALNISPTSKYITEFVIGGIIIMNTDIEAIKKLQQDVFELKERDDELSKVLEGLRIDKQFFLR